MRATSARIVSILTTVTVMLLGCLEQVAAQGFASPSSSAAQAPAGARSKGLRPPHVVVGPKAHARAAQITEEAQGHYNNGRFEEAAEAYRRAFAVVPAPELLFNLGQCQRLLGRPQRSVKYFEAYLRLKPDAPQRALVEQLIEEAKLITPAPQGVAQDTSPPAISALGSPKPPASPLPEAPSAQRNDTNVMPLPPPPPLPDAGPTRLLEDDSYTDAESPAVYERWWFWTALAVVAAGAAVTTYAVVDAQDEPESDGTLGTITWD